MFYFWLLDGFLGATCPEGIHKLEVLVLMLVIDGITQVSCVVRRVACGVIYHALLGLVHIDYKISPPLIKAQIRQHHKQEPVTLL